MSKQFWGMLAVIAILLGGVYFVTNKDDTKSDGNTGTPTKHITGENAAKVTFHEYGDFQCPVCATFFPVVEQVKEKYNKDLQFQFSHLPLTQLHPNAFAAARAAEAAGEQGKFFEMHDMLYQNQTAWSSSSSAQAIFNGYAQQLGLNLDQFKKDYSSSKVNSAINADIAAFKKTGEDLGTPTFFLDGKKIDNGQLFDSNNQPSLEKFSKFIDAAIAKKKAE
jgi:protein-disulfide isomerase